MKTIAFVLAVAAIAATAAEDLILRSDHKTVALLDMSYSNRAVVGPPISISQWLYPIQIDEPSNFRLPPGRYVGVVHAIHERSLNRLNCNSPTAVVKIHDVTKGIDRPFIAFDSIVVDEKGNINVSQSCESSLIDRNDNNILNRAIFFYDVTSGDRSFLVAQPPNNVFPPAVACAKVQPVTVISEYQPFETA